MLAGTSPKRLFSGGGGELESFQGTKLDSAAALAAGAPFLWAGNAISEALAGLLALTAADAEAGIAIVRWATGQLLRLLEAGRRERAQERVERLCQLLAEAGGQKTLRALANSNGFTAAEVRFLAARFPARLLIEKCPTAGRPTETATLVR